MPTRRRGPGDGTRLKPSVVEFLATGSTARAEREISCWCAITLNDRAAEQAREAWLSGDEGLALTLLRRTVASHHLFE
jgi:hypothetical protein